MDDKKKLTSDELFLLCEPVSDFDLVFASFRGGDD